MLTFLVSAEAIDKAPKSNDSNSKKEPTEFKQINKKKPREIKRRIVTPSYRNTQKSESKETDVAKTQEKTKEWFETQKGNEKYDYFIDRNNNGIDDRLEKNAEVKDIKRPEIIKKKAPATIEKTPVKVSPPPKNPEKIKDEGSSPQKKEPKAEKIEKKRENDRR